MQHRSVSSSLLSRQANNPAGRWDVPFVLLIARLSANDDTVTRTDWERAVGSDTKTRAAVAELSKARTIRETKAALLAGLGLKQPSPGVDLAYYRLACRIAKERAAELTQQARALQAQAAQLETSSEQPTQPGDPRS